MTVSRTTDTRPHARERYERVEGEVVLCLDDGLADQDAGARRRQLAGLLDAGPLRLLVELTGAAPLSSTMVAFVLETSRLCSARGIPVTVSHRSPAALQVLRRGGVGALVVLDRGGDHPVRPADGPVSALRGGR